MKPLRIAMVGACPFPVPQGSQVLLEGTARALMERGHEVHLVVYSYGIGDAPCGMAIHRCTHIPGLRRTAAGPAFMKPVADAALAAALRRLVREQHIELVHAHNYEGLLASLAALRGCGRMHIPLLYHAHNAMADELPYFLPRIPGAAGVGAWLDRHLPPHADGVIAPHRVLVDYLIACGCRPGKVSVAPPACDAALFDAVFSGPPANAPVVLYMGNLDAYQNLPLLGRAMRQVRRVMPEAVLCIATASRIASAALGPLEPCEVCATPDLDALRKVLQRSAVVACPRVSWSGYPMKLLNAMAAGKAIVACHGGAHPLENGRNGLVVEDGDEAAFAEALVLLLRDEGLRQTLGRQARLDVEWRHQPQDYAQTLEEAYQKVLRETNVDSAHASDGSRVIGNG